MSDRQGSNIPWWAIVLGFIFFWPVGMVLLFLSLGGVRIPTQRFNHFSSPDSAPGAAGPAPNSQSGYTYSAQQPAAGTASSGTSRRKYIYGSAQQSSQERSKAPSARGWDGRIKRGKAMAAFGALTSFVFLLALVDELSSYGFAFMDTWFPLLGFLCAGLVMAGAGVNLTRLSRRQRLYLGVIGQRSSIFLSDLALAAGVSEKRVAADLQKMLSDGILPMGYIDRASGRLVLTDQGYEAPPTAKAQPKEEAEKKPGDDAVLREIRAVNDAIADPEMSRKIGRIEEITGKILDFQRRSPAKSAQLHQFLSYYLPTTLKILKAYAQMESQGVEGENISAAKKRIEDMMDKVVEGFEKQLDQLFEADAMDITADVEVLERMLDRDGLGTGMTMET